MKNESCGNSRRPACGADRLLKEQRFRALVDGKKVAAVVNQTAVTGDYAFWPLLLEERTGANLEAVFSPEHGLWGALQDQVPCPDEAAGLRGTKVISLYGGSPESLKPDPRLLKGLDLVIFDIQDVGSRYYTYIYTMAYAMEAAAEAGLPFVVLDRPNPLGGEIVEGPALEEGYESFVGRFAGLPIRHGLTAGELALYIHRQHRVGLEPVVIPCSGWTRSETAFEHSAPWVPPSPNMPTPHTALVYPGMCLLEGTNLSEGRGTTRPFEIFGAPYLEPFAVAHRLNGQELPGVRFRPQVFVPTFGKHCGVRCGGAQIHVTDRGAFRPVLTGVAVICAARDLAGQSFAWHDQAYEFVERIPAIDLLYGSDRLRKMVEQGDAPGRIAGSYAESEAEFRRLRESFLLYK